MSKKVLAFEHYFKYKNDRFCTYDDSEELKCYHLAGVFNGFQQMTLCGIGSNMILKDHKDFIYQYSYNNQIANVELANKWKLLPLCEYCKKELQILNRLLNV